LEFTGLRSNERILDVGCGTGSLTFTIPQVADVAKLDGIDFSHVYVEAARHRNTDPRITISQGDVCALPFRAEPSTGRWRSSCCTSCQSCSGPSRK
jgi:ubiquinone/menaquinone biosynthesis C-methylase UbiE